MLDFCFCRRVPNYDPLVLTTEVPVQTEVPLTSAHVKGFRTPALMNDGAAHCRGPASESLQGRKPLGERAAVPRALWGFERCGDRCASCAGRWRTSIDDDAVAEQIVAAVRAER